MIMSDSAIQDVAGLETTGEDHRKHYLTRGTGAYRRASLALFLSG